jgi:hypothetical protein
MNAIVTFSFFSLFFSLHMTCNKGPLLQSVGVKFFFFLVSLFSSLLLTEYLGGHFSMVVHAVFFFIFIFHLYLSLSALVVLFFLSHPLFSINIYYGCFMSCVCRLCVLPLGWDGGLLPLLAGCMRDVESRYMFACVYFKANSLIPTFSYRSCHGIITSRSTPPGRSQLMRPPPKTNNFLYVGIMWIHWITE